MVLPKKRAIIRKICFDICTTKFFLKRFVLRNFTIEIFPEEALQKNFHLSSSHVTQLAPGKDLSLFLYYSSTVTSCVRTRAKLPKMGKSNSIPEDAT
jgi:hypothetical protein